VRIQIAFIAAVLISAMLAVPFFYSHRMNDGLFIGGLLTFVGIPLIAGAFDRSVTLAAMVLLLLCPIVGVITDPLAILFERLRDGYFLGTGSAIIFVSSIWIANCVRARKLDHIAIAILGLLSATVAVFILLWMVMYFE
jgi:hypothetical protein